MAAMSDGRLVVVAEDAARTEDRFFLLYLLRWAARNRELDIDLFLWHGGPLLERFAEVSDVHDLDDLNRWRLARLLERLRLRRLGQAVKGLRLRSWLRVTRRADAVYVVGGEAARIVGYLPRHTAPLALHLLDAPAFPNGLSESDRQAVLGRAGMVLVGSEAVADELAAQGDVDEAVVARHDHAIVVDADVLTSDRPPTRASLGIPADAVVVAATGTADWWAAPDPFVLMAWEVRRRVPDLDPWFLWLAPAADDRELWPLRHDLANAGVGDRVVIVTHEAAVDLLDMADVFVLATREDTHRSLTLEAAVRAVPVVRTDNGLVEELPGDVGVVVAALDLPALADAVADLVRDPERRRSTGEAQVSAATRVHDTDVGAPDLLAAILSGPWPTSP